MEKLDFSVKRNQAFIVTYFSKTREKFCGHLLGDDKQVGSSSSKLLSLREKYKSLVEIERKGSRTMRQELLAKVAKYQIACQIFSHSFGRWEIVLLGELEYFLVEFINTLVLLHACTDLESHRMVDNFQGVLIFVDR